ncbi:hypothetical protein G6F57_008809 [Rhizopus arrhizus]|uniref:Reverse transcriptase zinc-binding domain-containing protein n=1 Tax=Rhizopus oryzae TaxID=64495 RepID=A0A9P6X604_RHIOR|nr:hypothetical protein G6F23_006872 [Rhizopus arrhizus]KAG1419325.1 hypothetical protein G6F58_004664 [Rhizopus delemar]KAG0942080.1 hypothetical protein G6F32_008179 [Rhizopus arrhizus]KAG1065450.1 hypothetical protein G6F41_009248 [Rhizopus arrhizus]KAG1296102.1 hypothetical protein G6F66_003757 [Rhizopus arrhizus]
MFRTLDHIGYETNWTDLNTSTAEEIPFMQSQIAEEDFFVALKSSPNCVFGGSISSFGFQHPAPQFASLFSLPLPDDTPVEKLSTKWFRNLDMLPVDSLPSTYPRASKSSWNKFWHASIPHPARTTLWRLYHSNPPIRSHLHKIMPRYITDEGCMTCGAIETDERYLDESTMKIYTVKKLLVWRWH